MSFVFDSFCVRTAILGATLLSPLAALAGQSDAGPFLGHILAGGPPLRKPVPAESLGSGSGWAQSLWFSTQTTEDTIVAGAGTLEGSGSRYFVVGPHTVSLWSAGHLALSASIAVDLSRWHLLTASGSGDATVLAFDGAVVATGASLPRPTDSIVELAPLPPASSPLERFSGEIGGFSLQAAPLTPDAIASAYRSTPDFAAQLREENAKPWPLQTKGQAGYAAPQSPGAMPHGAPATRPATPHDPPDSAALIDDGAHTWRIANRWRMISATDASIAPHSEARISSPGYATSAWYPATVPGTVLTTLVDRGVYPDPYYGLNNLSIPESLNRHDWWYRVEFATPSSPLAGGRYTLHLEGINYAAEVWFNGQRLGSVRGAFRRGDFDLASRMKPGGNNVLAIRISPPPHPGIPQEQSLLGGPGENGGAMVTDGPTFVATEGWDWIPAIRDRDAGIWQGVFLRQSAAITLGDPQVITHLPLPNRDSADLTLRVPLHNALNRTVHGELDLSFEGVTLHVPFDAAPGDKLLALDSRSYPQLHLIHPRLWWPNGYGSPELYHLKLDVRVAGQLSDERMTTFGVREISYELSLFDHTGHLRRLEAAPTSSLAAGHNPVDVRHEAMRQTVDGWASSTSADLEGTPALAPISNEPGMTDLVLKVNGVRIAARGGNWGMDDAMKRVDRARLEPYFRLHREANLNIIRNWVGQDTEESFYQLADEYGMMVWNDFWASTQDYNAEPGDAALFLDNARDTVHRYRNHPSIVLWCGRNEGVPPPVINEGLIALLAAEDGTRLYSPSSNRVNLRDSGPYSWQEPSLYFSKLNRGFSVELGISSFPTREAFAAAIAPQDLWPISDAWAYHDWHQAGGGDTHPLMQQMATRLGQPEDLNGFERRIQLFNYVDHRAIFEGFYQHLWSPNSGRMLWMTHPAWPSTMWQIYSSDYDTQASFYGVKKANEPVHPQLDLSDGTVAIVNTTLDPKAKLLLKAEVYSPENLLLHTAEQSASIEANQVAPLLRLPLDKIFAQHPLVFVRLDLRDTDGNRVGDNFYWIAKDAPSYQGLNQLPQANVALTATASRDTPESTITVRLRNQSGTPAIEAKLTLLDPQGKRILPAYYSDNYLSLLAGEEREITIHVPAKLLPPAFQLTLRGWNLHETATSIP